MIIDLKDLLYNQVDSIDINEEIDIPKENCNLESWNKYIEDILIAMCKDSLKINFEVMEEINMNLDKNGNVIDKDIPEYNKITEDDDLTVVDAKKEAQKKQVEQNDK